MPENRPSVSTILIISSTMFESQLAYSKSIAVIYWCQRNGRRSDKLQFVEARVAGNSSRSGARQTSVCRGTLARRQTEVCRSSFARRQTEVCRTKFVGLRTRNSRTGRLALCEIWEELVSEPIS